MAERSFTAGVVGRLVVGIVAIVGLVGIVKVLLLARHALPDDALGPAGPGAEPVRAAAGDARFTIPDSLRGRSGALRFTALTAAEAQAMPGFLATYGDSILLQPSVVQVSSGSGDGFAVLLMRPFAAKRGERVGAYRLGWWPAERWMMASNYLNPDGFVEVTPASADLPLSTHFRLADFLTRDGQDVWPRYLVLEERLIDKLELVLRELQGRGVDAQRVRVLSGFRAPYYNDLQVDEGAARASRHQYGDAADIVIDADGDGRMDDLNRDGRFDLQDARVISDAVAAVERRFPELTGGLGTYAAMGPAGPFAHVDVRGTSARWERTTTPSPAGGPDRRSRR
jgi:uncharacterized protein YcbK (DUF882 family)